MKSNGGQCEGPTQPEAAVEARQQLIDSDGCDFVTLVERYQPMMLRVARRYVADSESANDVVQETWLAAMRGLAGFEERSTFKTWLFAILIKRARSYGKRQSRVLCFSSWQNGKVSGEGAEEQAYLPQHRVGGAKGIGDRLPEEALLAQELRYQVETFVAALPKQQQQVMTLHDLEGYPFEEISSMLQISAGNVRVLLHRAHTKVRQMLRDYLEQLV
ncbi:MAG: sigma-70 family RNA polymerase sigma factor [Caldilineaceae bacterium]|nr:sigma-70 family RNA polymerase sigma factor [Caldilineaceae bacterium]